jgi:hypothetical protein
MGLWLNVCNWTNIWLQNSTGVTKYDRLNIKMTQIFLLNYVLKIIVLKSKPFIKVKIIQGLDFFSEGLKFVPDWRAFSVRSWQH